MKEGMREYIYWYSTRGIKMNKFKTNHKTNCLLSITMGDMRTLEEWSHCDYGDVIYNSYVDGKEGTTFRERIMNHRHLYFIVFDAHNKILDIITMPKSHYQVNSQQETTKQKLCLCFYPILMDEVKQRNLIN